jgi:hypothetical protein
MDQSIWLLPTQMSGNPGWLRPLRRLLSIVDVKSLFHTLDRVEGVREPPAHQVLIPPLLRKLQRPTSPQQLSATGILSDDRWLQIRSSAPLQSWCKALQREGKEPPMEDVRQPTQAADAVSGWRRRCIQQRLRKCRPTLSSPPSNRYLGGTYR